MSSKVSYFFTEKENRRTRGSKMVIPEGLVAFETKGYKEERELDCQLFTD